MSIHPSWMVVTKKYSIFFLFRKFHFFFFNLLQIKRNCNKNLLFPTSKDAIVSTILIDICESVLRFETKDFDDDFFPQRVGLRRFPARL